MVNRLYSIVSTMPNAFCKNPGDIHKIMIVKSGILLVLLFPLLLSAQDRTARTIPGTALLIPEGIAVCEKDGSIFISSIAQHKIIRIDSNFKAVDFISSGRDNFLEGLGMKTDEARGLLWVHIRK